MTASDGSRHRLRLVDMDGELVLSEGYPIDRPFKIATLGDDADFGNPEPFDVTIPSQMLNGEDERTTRWGNRDLFFRVQVSAPDGVALAQGEAALMARLGRRAELHWTPPAPASPTTVFTVVNSRLEATFSDMDELRTTRTYGIRMRAMPFGKSVAAISEEVSSPAVSTPVLLHAGGASPTVPFSFGEGEWATGDLFWWTVSVSQGDWSGSTAYDMAGMRFVRITLDTTTYLGSSGLVKELTYRLSVSTAPSGSGWVDCSLVARVGSVHYFRVPVGAFRRYAVAAYVRAQADTNGPGVYTASLSAVSLERIDSLPSNGKQSVRFVDTVGSAPAPQSLEVARDDNTSDLGDVLLYTSPTLARGFSPDLRQFQIGGVITPDFGNLVTNSHTTAPTFRVPMSDLPAGVSYVLVARFAGPAELYGTKSFTFDWSAKVRSLVGGFDADVATVNGRGYATVATTTSSRAFHMAVLGSFNLPTDVPAGSEANLQLTVTPTSNDGGYSSDVVFDEVWMFPVGADDQLSIIRAGAASGKRGRRIWWEPASLDRSRHAVWMGDAANRADAIHVGDKAITVGEHRLPAGRGGIFVAASRVMPTVRRTYVPHWHSNAAS